MAYKGYHFRCANQQAYFDALLVFMEQIGWEVHVNKFKAYTTLTSTGNCANGNTLTIDGKVYTMKTALTPAEGEILLGGTAADSLANIKLAINRTDPGTNDGVKYKIAAAHSTVSAETLTATTLFIQALTAGTAGNSLATTETLANMTLTGATLANGSNNKVFKSNGESGYEPYGYVYLVNSGSGVEVYSYQYWDETLLPQGTGAYRLSASYAYQASDRVLRAALFTSTTECFMGGDKDFVWLTPHMALTDSYVTPYAGWACGFGHISRRFYTPEYPVITTNELTAGNNVTISVNDTSGLWAGSYCQILGKQVSTFEGCDKLRIQSITNSTDFVVDNVPRNYVAGAFIGNPASVFGALSHGYNGNVVNRFFPCSYWDDAGKSVAAYTSYYPIGAMLGNYGTGGRSLKSFLSPFWLSFSGSMVGYITTPFYADQGIANVYDCLIANNDLSIPPQYTVSSATNNTLTDLSKSWTPDALIGKYVVLTVGLSNGQARKIIDNDATSITIDKDWDVTNPDGTTNYKICDVLYRDLYAGWNTGSRDTHYCVKITDTSIPA